MSETERDILHALVELSETAEKPRDAGPKPDLIRLFVRIDELAAQLPHDASRDLVHYLERKSYDKARSWLEARAAKV
jgi:hypothetical protein